MLAQPMLAGGQKGAGRLNPGTEILALQRSRLPPDEKLEQKLEEP